MTKDIFAQTPNWSYSQNDAEAEKKLGLLVQETVKTLPEEIRDGK